MISGTASTPNRDHSVAPRPESFWKTPLSPPLHARHTQGPQLKSSQVG